MEIVNDWVELCRIWRVVAARFASRVASEERLALQKKLRDDNCHVHVMLAKILSKLLMAFAPLKAWEVCHDKTSGVLESEA